MSASAIPPGLHGPERDITCPACRKPVRKIISTFNSPVKTKPVSFSDAKKAGFTVLKRLGKGEYEKQ